MFDVSRVFALGNGAGQGQQQGAGAQLPGLLGPSVAQFPGLQGLGGFNLGGPLGAAAGLPGAGGQASFPQTGLSDLQLLQAQAAQLQQFAGQGPLGAGSAAQLPLAALGDFQALQGMGPGALPGGLKLPLGDGVGDASLPGMLGPRGVAGAQHMQHLFAENNPRATRSSDSRSSSAYASRHQAAEQRRRTRINERWVLLDWVTRA